ncbi:MIR motif-containing protein [Zychaea mexicana]|uniref:MIR motif-containing protein n=1 Tax=Zychaea mexicana TaxID=64656 RepID=UPI0022FDC284|nr:MIR motif-containing protein [Zychaea mexicana]KAI9493407.1 MIR motif-containing protein [Zychaea mexicana]
MSDCEEEVYEEQQEEQQENDFEKGSRPEDGTVHYGNVIYLKHDATEKFLNSEDGDNYEEGSGQQKVYTCDDESEWLVLPIAGQEDQMSYQVGFDDQFRLLHVASGRYLHSHPDIASPVTGQQEVTAFGSEEESDENDTWQLQAFPDHEYDPEDYLWHLEIPIVIRHVMTGQTLHSHEEELGDDHFEVTGYVGTDDNDKWQAV